jgi:hypothetical protein
MGGSPEVVMGGSRLGGETTSRRSHVLPRQTAEMGSRGEDSELVCSFWRVETVIRQARLSIRSGGRRGWKGLAKGVCSSGA